jgi:dipeptidyl aminopeptidase/acylaminoacyl peptidase
VGSLASSPPEQSQRPLLQDADAAAYVPRPGRQDGYLLFVRDGDLFAQRFDPGRLELAGTPLAVAQKLARPVIMNGLFARRLPGFAVSPKGVLVYRSELRPEGQITVLDRRGNVVDKVGEPGVVVNLTFAPDGNSLAAVRQESPGPNEWDVWLHELRGTRRSTRWSEPLAQNNPVWSPDRSRVVYSSGHPRQLALYEKKAQSSGPGRLLYAVEGMDLIPRSWSPDGRHILLCQNSWVYDVEIGKARPLIPDSFCATFSPDGRWVSYSSVKSGGAEIYVRPFDPDVEPGELPEWMVSRGRVSSPSIWVGNEIFYRGIAGEVMSVRVAARGGPHPAVQAQTPEVLFTSNSFTPGGVGFAILAVSPDAQRFAILAPVVNPDATAYKVVLNWTAGLE